MVGVSVKRGIVILKQICYVISSSACENGMLEQSCDMALPRSGK